MSILLRQIACTDFSSEIVPDDSDLRKKPHYINYRNILKPDLVILIMSPRVHITSIGERQPFIYVRSTNVSVRETITSFHNVVYLRLMFKKKVYHDC